VFKKEPAALEDHPCKSSKNNYPGNSPTRCLLWMAFYLVVTKHTSNSMSCRPILFGFTSFTVSNVLPLVSLKPPENETRESILLLSYSRARLPTVSLPIHTHTPSPCHYSRCKMVKKRGRDRIFWHSMSEPASTQGNQFWWGKEMDVGCEFFF